MLVGGHAVGDPVDLGQQDRQFLVDGGAARRWQATDGDIPIGQCIGIEVGQLGKLPLLIDLELGQADPRDSTQDTGGYAQDGPAPRPLHRHTAAIERVDRSHRPAQAGGPTLVVAGGVAGGPGPQRLRRAPVGCRRVAPGPRARQIVVAQGVAPTGAGLDPTPRPLEQVLEGPPGPGLGVDPGAQPRPLADQALVADVDQRPGCDLGRPQLQQRRRLLREWRRDLRQLLELAAGEALQLAHGRRRAPEPAAGVMLGQPAEHDLRQLCRRATAQP